MFPNIRLMVVAILAATAGIGCGLGLFATFRVNHEPLARLADASPPLQLAFDNVALGSDARAPLEARSPVSGAAKVISVPVIVPTPSPAAEQTGADTAIAEGSSVQRAAADAGTADGSSAVRLAVAVSAEQSNATPAAAAPSQQETAQDQQPVVAAREQQPAAAAQDQQPALSAAIAPTAEQTAAVGATAEDHEPTAKPAKSGDSKAAQPAVRASRPAAQARRPSRTVRARRTPATVAAQPAYQYSQPAYSQPTYTWTDGVTQASQPAKRVLIMRHRAAKKAVPAAPPNPSAATSGPSGT